MISISDLPELNATLNGISAVLLICGYIFIRKRNIPAHKFCMQAAFVTSVLFLVSYLTYHYHTGHKVVPGQGTSRPIYYSILISHVVLAAAIVPLALMTLSRAWKGAFDRHKRIARRTLPIWMYVSVTGVVVYWMLYRM